MVPLYQYLSISHALNYSYNNPMSLLQLLSPFTDEETDTQRLSDLHKFKQLENGRIKI